MLQLMITPEQYEREAQAIFGDRRLFTTAEAAQLAKCSAKTVMNASSANELVGSGRGANRLYHLWEIYKWEQHRRMPKRERTMVKRTAMRVEPARVAA